jgi:hypothetical protein
LAHDGALDKWLRTEVAMAYHEMKAAPSKGLSADDVLKSLKAETRRQTKSG